MQTFSCQTWIASSDGTDGAWFTALVQAGSPDEAMAAFEALIADAQLSHGQVSASYQFGEK